MPTAKSNRRGHEEKNRKGKLSEKAMSFHGRTAESMAGTLLRPRTVPDLLAGKRLAGVSKTETTSPTKLTKLLLNVTIQRSLGAVHVLISPESTVGDLIVAALRQYVKEGRRPIFSSMDASCFGLHYSQFSLECLDTEAKLITLGSRNFFLCPRNPSSEGGSGSATATATSCSKEAEKGTTKTGMPWLKFMEFLL